MKIGSHFLRSNRCRSVAWLAQRIELGVHPWRIEGLYLRLLLHSRLIHLRVQQPVFLHMFLCLDVVDVDVIVKCPTLSGCRMKLKLQYRSYILLFVHQIGTLEL